MLARGQWDMGDKHTVQRCKSACGLCKSAKVKTGEGLGPGLGLEIRENRRPSGSVEQRDLAIKGSSIGKSDS